MDMAFLNETSRSSIRNIFVFKRTLNPSELKKVLFFTKITKLNNTNIKETLF